MNRRIPIITVLFQMPKLNIAKILQGVDKRWLKVFTSKKMLTLLARAIDRLGEEEKDISKIVPPVNQIFNFAKFKYSKIKIVIIGQDPYPASGDAHGLSFSSKNKKIPASLRNIYKCLKKCKLIDTKPNTADLTYWAHQGVLLLNASLTTRLGVSNAHKKIWKPFTDELIRYISHDDTCGPGDSLIFMLWGRFAQKKECLINEDCVIYKWTHPSPLAETRLGPEENKKKFKYCDHFVEANDMLQNTMELKPIDWNPVPHYEIYTDGACSNNGKGVFSTAGYASYFARGPLANIIKYGRVPPSIIGTEMVYGTSQRAEGLGIIVALESVLEHSINTPIQPRITIVTDSKFWKSMIEDWMPKWEIRGICFDEKEKSRLDH